MSVGWKTLDTQNNSLTVNLSEDDLHGFSRQAGASHLLA